MDKAVTTNKIEQLIKLLASAHSNGDVEEMRLLIKEAENLALQIRQQIRKA